MATCKDCIHYEPCYEYGNILDPIHGGVKCDSFKAAADVVPKSEVERLTDILNSYALQYGTATDQQKVIDQAKTEVAREFFEEIEKQVASKIPMKFTPIFKRDLGYDAGVIDGKHDAFYEVLVLIAELKKKYTKRCPKCKHFVGCECFDGKTCDEYEEGENDG